VSGSAPVIPQRGPHSRLTGFIRLVVSVWLIVSAVRTLADPQNATNEQQLPLGALLPIAGLSFTLGIFLLTGFMSRIIGLVMFCLGVWELINLRLDVAPALLAVAGIYLMLRGGGAWAMDIYVQKMQDRARRKAALSSPESM
jgi:uncharacterized membrane protein YphA (DoxX/SURF4 family)